MQPVANQPSVHENENRIAVVLLHLRARNKSAQRELARRFVGFGHLQGLAALAQFDQVVEQLAAEHLKDALAQGRDRRGMQQVRAAVPQFERLIRMRQAVVRHERRDVRQFGLFRAQEFLARRHIEEQIAHGDGGAAAARDFVAAQNFAARDFDARAGLLVGRTRFEQQARDRGDGGQRLAAKAQRGDREQIFHVVQLAGGVALEGQQGVVAQHAAAIVGDADQPPAAVFDFDADVGGARRRASFRAAL